MPNHVRTARGKIVDFDLMKVKTQIASAPKPVKVQERENFIDRKLRRKLRKARREAAAKKAANNNKTVDVGTNVVKAAPAATPVKQKTTRRRVRRK